ncbi:acetyltransferase [Photobacterium damselae]|nr:acetyltransferase [Photobacterium damselae]
MVKNSYGFYEILKTIISLFYTKVFYAKARLIRLPFYMRGKEKMVYNKGLTTGYGCRIECFSITKNKNATLKIGINCHMGDYVHIASGEEVIIGDNCLLASKIYISDISHGIYSGDGPHSSPDIEPRNHKLYTKPVYIGNNVWIGEGVSILPGTVIGDGCIIGANSVVNKNIDANCLAVGSPAKVIKKYDKLTQKWILV